MVGETAGWCMIATTPWTRLSPRFLRWWFRTRRDCRHRRSCSWSDSKSTQAPLELRFLLNRHHEPELPRSFRCVGRFISQLANDVEQFCPSHLWLETNRFASLLADQTYRIVRVWTTKDLVPEVFEALLNFSSISTTYQDVSTPRHLST